MLSLVVFGQLWTTFFFCPSLILQMLSLRLSWENFFHFGQLFPGTTWTTFPSSLILQMLSEVVLGQLLDNFSSRPSLILQMLSEVVLGQLLDNFSLGSVFNFANVVRGCPGTTFGQLFLLSVVNFQPHKCFLRLSWDNFWTTFLWIIFSFKMLSRVVLGQLLDKFFFSLFSAWQNVVPSCLRTTFGQLFFLSLLG